MTRAATELQDHLDRRWPSLLFEGINCRRIAGTTTWSQHAWPGGNARDIFGPDKDDSPSSQALLDVIAQYLRVNQKRMGIKSILWRVRDHYNHIHADMWPTGYLTPPCGGGRERYMYSDGRIVRAVGGNVPPQGLFDLEDIVIVRPGAKGNYIRPYQQALDTWAAKQSVPNWTRLARADGTYDGDYGPDTAAAVTRYQAASEITGIIPLPGALDDLTRDLLERFVEA